MGRSDLGKTLGWVLILTSITSPAIAHTVEITEDVAGTWHVEPNHTPKAGEPTEVWIALTRKGGATLPLAEAECQLAVYSQPRQPGDAPILQPTLQAIDSEQHQGIPGANLVFPKTGLYQLDLSCTPKTAEDFHPFEMTYDVTVAEGTAATPTTSPTPAASELATPSPTLTEPTALPEPHSDPSPLPWIGGVALVAIAAIGGYVWWQRK